MKTNMIQDVLRNKGFERGVQYILEQQNEDIATIKKNMLALANMFNQMTDSLNNVVRGTEGMKLHLEKQMKKAGILVEADDLPANTKRLGED